MRMKPPFRYRLSEAEKDALLIEQSVLIERLTGRISEFEAAINKPQPGTIGNFVCWGA